ncbi:glycoside hydrolase family 43 protein [Pseudobutyrivibrio ruminis]|uniref:glycoside hydrolase family 43 protein n=1 Tax=Pseudobutyrivibrio ruminis TaxID=46206 RepID=UPI00051C4FE6|nr:glycoside hydrolase family 43 protein [Pseudobutyrivibrio ruminis]
MSYKLHNPIIPGFYPDPSIIRVEDDFYIAVSSFELYPGIPIFHSKDLAHWEQIANAMGPNNGFHMEKNCGVGGVMAPTLRYHKGTYYIINTNFADKGNYIITATDPKGPWSEPHWLDDVPGIDASIFFDNDDKCYVMGTGDCWDNGTGHMERGIWVAEFDIDNFKLKSEPFTIFNSALRNAASPESPHLYHIGDYYYLMIAEGGTEHYHSVAVARSKELFSFFEGNPANPVLTHRHMGFRCPITNVGHADLVQLQDGSWYAVMLASRLIDGEFKNLGRETFICPVIWERDWPVFAPETGKVEWEYEGPNSLAECAVKTHDSIVEFDTDELPLDMIFWGQPKDDIWKIEDSKLKLKCIRQKLDDDMRQMSFEVELSEDNYVSFLGKRQTGINQSFSCEMNFTAKGYEAAGLALSQAFNHQLLIARCEEAGEQMLKAIVVTSDYEIPPYIPGFTSKTNRNVVASIPYNNNTVVLKLKMEGEDFTVYYGESENDYKELCKVDGSVINPEKVGCMTGTIVGMFATGNGFDSNNWAEFDWFKTEE